MSREAGSESTTEAAGHRRSGPDSGEPYRLTPMQHGMVYRHLSGSRAGVDVQQIVGDLREEVDPDALESAWREMARREPALRRRVEDPEADEPLQREAARVEVPFEVLDWRELSGQEQEEAVEELLRRDREEGFRLDEPPLFRFRLIRAGESRFRFLWSFHHFLMDGFSCRLVLRDVFRLYEPLRDGKPLPPPGDRRPFREFAREIRRRAEADDADFWRDYLRGLAGRTPLPLDGVAAAPAGEGPPGEIERRLPADVTARLSELADAIDVRLSTLVLGAWGLLLARHADEEEAVFGVIHAGRPSLGEEAWTAVGVLINTLPIRVEVDPGETVSAWLRRLRGDQLRLREHEHTPLVDARRWSPLPPDTPLFETLLVYDDAEMGTSLRREGGGWGSRDVRVRERTGYPLTLRAYGEEEGMLLHLVHERDRVGSAPARRILSQLAHLLEAFAAEPDRRLGELDILPPDEREALRERSTEARTQWPEDACVHELVERQAGSTPDRVAVEDGGSRLTYRELDRRADRVADGLRRRGVGPGTLVGIAARPSCHRLAGLLGVLKAGGAYLPLDPSYPEARLRFMVDDSGVELVLADRPSAGVLPGAVEVVDLDAVAGAAEPGSGEAPGAPSGGDDAGSHGGGPEGGRPAAADAPPARPDDLAYVIYTSGSTGTPKAVMVEHRNAVSFFAGMDERVGGGDGDVWLAVTSLSFDISVLEQLWTLTRGYRVVLHDRGRPAPGPHAGPARAAPAPRPGRAGGGRGAGPEFGLFYFAAGGGDEDGPRYRLLLEGARAADRYGFGAVWTPERHFHDFGGLFPNPAVTGAALAGITDHVSIRAGSVVLPLHHPARVAEEWSVVDNISGGRVEIAFASGWQRDDFVLAREPYEARREVMDRSIETVRRLWRGETVAFRRPDGEEVEVELYPRPVQPELPIWLTAAGSEDTFRRAGEIGAGVLTHLLGQSVEEVAEKIAAYRRAWREAGRPEGQERVAVMLHTFVGRTDDEVREIVRPALTAYLRSSVSLIRNYADVWESKSAEGGTAARGDEFAELSEEDLDSLLDQAFERYFRTSGLLGSPGKCREMVERLRGIGADELACLVDFGVDQELVLESLEALAELRTDVRGEPSRAAGEDASGTPPAASGTLDVAERIRRHGVTHMQCTPSQATLLLADRASREALGRLETLLVGGEPLPATLAGELMEAVGGRVVNMYGPTETTVWSSTHEVGRRDVGEAAPGTVAIGRPIANTEFHVLDSRGRRTPMGAAGELYIGGPGVTRGYRGRPGLTSRKYVSHPFRDGARLYRTGDVVRYREDGVVQFLGRSDRQVKVRGHRVEPGEVESALRTHEEVREAAVVVRGEELAERRLVAYVVAGDPDRPPSAESLRDHLRARLPEAMVPSAFAVLDELPRTPNQKLDRQALPEADVSADRSDGAGGRTVMEEEVAAIWSEVLGLDPSEVDGSFFELGGNSLSSIQVAHRIRDRFGVELPLRVIFEQPTVPSLAEAVEEELLASAEDAEIADLLEEMASPAGGEDGR